MIHLLTGKLLSVSLKLFRALARDEVHVFKVLFTRVVTNHVFFFHWGGGGGKCRRVEEGHLEMRSKSNAHSTVGKLQISYQYFKRHSLSSSGSYRE